jgi:hypothetical protein
MRFMEEVDGSVVWRPGCTRLGLIAEMLVLRECIGTMSRMPLYVKTF